MNSSIHELSIGDNGLLSKLSPSKIDLGFKYGDGNVGGISIDNDNNTLYANACKSMIAPNNTCAIFAFTINQNGILSDPKIYPQKGVTITQSEIDINNLTYIDQKNNILYVSTTTDNNGGGSTLISCKINKDGTLELNDFEINKDKNYSKMIINNDLRASYFLNSWDNNSIDYFINGYGN